MLKDFIYITDNQKRYLIRLDAAIGEISSLGFSSPNISDKDLDFLPRGLKVRTVFCSPDNRNSVLEKGGARTFAVGKPTATILTDSSAFSYKGKVYLPRKYHPEKRRKQQTRS